jgi:hypothetical protein
MYAVQNREFLQAALPVQLHSVLIGMLVKMQRSRWRGWLEIVSGSEMHLEEVMG